MEIHIVRHASVSVDKSICYGQSEVDLNENYFNEWIKLNQKLDEDYNFVYSSPLSRCLKYTNEFYPDKSIVDDRLKEMNFGNWEMKHWNQIPNDELTKWMNDFDKVVTPNGESFERLFQRVQEFYTEIKSQTHDKILIVTHAGVIRCFWAIILQIELKNAFKVPIGYGEVLKIDTQFDIIIQKA